MVASFQQSTRFFAGAVEVAIAAVHGRQIQQTRLVESTLAVLVADAPSAAGEKKRSPDAVDDSVDKCRSMSVSPEVSAE